MFQYGSLAYQSQSNLIILKARHLRGKIYKILNFQSPMCVLRL